MIHLELGIYCLEISQKVCYGKFGPVVLLILLTFNSYSFIGLPKGIFGYIWFISLFVGHNPDYPELGL